MKAILIIFLLICVWGIYMSIVTKIMGKKYVSDSLKNMERL
jgi:hypothetical protein